MNLQKNLLNTLFGLLVVSTAPVYATAISNAQSSFLWDASSINGNPINNQLFLVDAETSLFNDTLDQGNQQGDAFDTYLEQSGVNVSAASGYDGIADAYIASTSSNSDTSDNLPASAEAFTSIYIPFQADASEQASVSIFYDLFASAEALLAGESSLAIAALAVSLLDDGFNNIEFGLSDELIANAQNSADFPNAIQDSLNYTFSGLTDGDSYFIAIDTSALSTTAANAVPEPGALLLVIMSLVVVGGAGLDKRRFTPIFNHL